MFTHRDYLPAVLEPGSIHHDSSVEKYDEDWCSVSYLFFYSWFWFSLYVAVDGRDYFSFVIRSCDADKSSSSLITSQLNNQIILEEIDRDAEQIINFKLKKDLSFVYRKVQR